MYNEGYADGGGGSASSCMMAAGFIIHFTLKITLYDYKSFHLAKVAIPLNRGELPLS